VCTCSTKDDSVVRVAERIMQTTLSLPRFPLNFSSEYMHAY
jgi:hypothetical protein